jgi:hypothetical protein
MGGFRVVARVLVGMVPMCLLSATLAGAQPSVDATGPRPRLRVGQLVWVTGADGQRVRGNVASMSITDLVVKEGSTPTALSWSGITRIETIDSVFDGLGKGAGIGALSGSLTGVFIAGSLCESGGCPEWVLGYTALGAGIGAGVGLLADSLHHQWRTVYQGTRGTVSVAPLIHPQRVGVAGTLRW